MRPTRELNLVGIVGAVIVLTAATLGASSGPPSSAGVSPQAAGAPTAPATPPQARRPADGENSKPRWSAPRWGAPGIGVQHPVVPRVTCPDELVMDEAGNRLKELAENISRFDAVEEIVHEEQTERGTMLRRVTRKYAYVVMVVPRRSDAAPPMPTFNEDRLSLSGLSDFPGGIGTLGLPTLAFVFHPGMRETFEMACDGLGHWQGEPAWLVRFRQREDRPNYLQAYTIGGRSHPVALKGRAWVAARTFQVIHMEAELVRPMPEIKLLVQHYIVDYGQVKFQKGGADLWLPKQAELYFHFRGRRYYRRHSFDNFRLFSVDSSQKVTSPKNDDEQQ